jgi:hypothetical protein
MDSGNGIRGGRILVRNKLGGVGPNLRGESTLGEPPPLGAFAG